MSLHTLASQLQSAGRGDDKVLVHMTPAEVGGLQSLAKAHGGSLTVNPETGLPEAGFLSSILPMIAGLALAPMTAGTSLAFLGSPLGAAALVGGGTALATGDLRKGLMAGLGAYGGAGLGAGLSSMGATKASALASTGAPQSTLAGNTAASKMFAAPDIVQSPLTSVAGTGMPYNAQSVMFQNAPAQLAAGSPFAGTGINAANFPGAATVAQANAPAGLSALPQAVATPVSAPVTAFPQLTSDQLASKAFNAPGVISPPGPPMLSGLKAATSNGMQGLKDLYAASEAAAPYSGMAALGSLALAPRDPMDVKKDNSLIRPYDFAYNPTDVASQPYTGSAERMHFNPMFTARTPYAAPGPEYAVGGPVEEMAALNSVGSNTGYPMATISTPMYSNPMVQRPEATNVISPSSDVGVGAFTGEPRFAGGGLSDLGSYSDGGRLLKGPGDGVSDSIPAVIGNRQPARLADGEFVIPARIVSELGNGSTEAGAKRLYAMMDRVQAARRKTVGKDRVAKDTNAEKHLPA